MSSTRTLHPETVEALNRARVTLALTVDELAKAISHEPELGAVLNNYASDAVDLSRQIESFLAPPPPPEDRDEDTD